VIHSLVRMSSEIFKVSFDYMLEIMKHEVHGSLEGCSDVFNAERNFSVCESTPRTNKCHLMLILGFNMNLVVS
jgi:hypothetical protein